MAEEGRDTVAYGDTVVLSGARFCCTGCQEWKSGSDFGLRKMADGKIRNQAQCSSCRSEATTSPG